MNQIIIIQCSQFSVEQKQKLSLVKNHQLQLHKVGYDHNYVKLKRFRLMNLTKIRFLKKSKFKKKEKNIVLDALYEKSQEPVEVEIIDDESTRQSIVGIELQQTNSLIITETQTIR